MLGPCDGRVVGGIVGILVGELVGKFEAFEVVIKFGILLEKRLGYWKGSKLGHWLVNAKVLKLERMLDIL